MCKYEFTTELVMEFFVITSLMYFEVLDILFAMPDTEQKKRFESKFASS